MCYVYMIVIISYTHFVNIFIQRSKYICVYPVLKMFFWLELSLFLACFILLINIHFINIHY